jgi:hypothetical protein
MALTKTLSAAAEERFRLAQLGKYSTLAHAATASTGFDPTSVYTDRTVIAERGLDFFEATLENLRAATGGSAYTIGRFGSAYVVYVPNFIAGAKKLKVITRASTIKFTSAVTANLDPGNLVAINGSFCALSTANKLAAGNTTIDPALVTPVGYVYSNGSQVAGGRASSDGFHAQFSNGQFDLGSGDATAGDGVGGLTPILLKQADLNKVWKYGDKNIYSADLPAGADVPEKGPPPEAFRSYIVQRSNSQYADVNNEATGKSIFGYIPSRDFAVFVVQPDDPEGGGHLFDFYRDVLFTLNCEYAVGLDGSDSVMLYEYKTRKLLATPGPRKNNYLEVALVART